MNLIRVRQLLALDHELDTEGVLRRHTRDDQLYKIDRRRWLAAVIESMFETEDDEGSSNFEREI